MAELKAFDINQLKAVEVSLASPQEIREWSHGEVTKAETINYRTQKPEPDGLFCERIFGPAKDYNCRCGKYVKKQYAGIVCEKCGVEVTVKDVRRERMGHIELAAPCTHIWFLKGASASTIGKVIDVQLKPLTEVVYYNAYICLDPGESEIIQYRQVFTESIAKEVFVNVIKNEVMPRISNPEDYDYSRAEDFIERLTNPNETFDFASLGRFVSKYLHCEFGDGAAAIKKLLQQVNIDEEYTKIIAEIGSYDNVCGYDVDGIYNRADADLVKSHLSSLTNSIKACYFDRSNRHLYVEYLNKDIDIAEEIRACLDPEHKLSVKLSKKAEGQKLANLIKRLSVISGFKNSNNKPEWMVLDVLPVIPPSLRPMTQIGGKFVASDLNELYRRVIIRNARLKRDIEACVPAIILDNEKRMLQNAVDALIDNSRCSKPFKGPGGREYKSLTSALKGKPGRFRQNLLGKRVDFSGRSVIAVGPDLKMYQCGLPREMAIQLLRPFIEEILIKTPGEGKKASVQNGYGKNYKEANRMIDAYDPIVYSIVERIIGEHPVLLNRAPTLHRLGIQAFQPKLVDGRAIRLHPLVCKGFNADFDGDQMAVHVPLSKEAQEEAINLMLASNNILGPKNGKPIAVPSQDMILGNYYLTIEESAQDFLDRANRREASGDISEAEKFRLYAEAEGKIFSDIKEIRLAYATKQIHLHNRIAIPANKCGKNMPVPSENMSEEEWNRVIRLFGDISLEEYTNVYNSYLVTTVGKVIFNHIFPSDFPYINDPKKQVKEGQTLKTELSFFVPRGTNIKEYVKGLELKGPAGKKQLEPIIGEVFDRYIPSKTSAVLDAIKDNGFKYSTVAGFTISLSDIKPTEGKEELLKEADKYVDELNEKYEWGLIDEKRRVDLVVARWKSVTEKVTKMTVKQLNEDKRNPVFMIFDSGARGNKSQFNQMLGIRGVMANPKGEAIEIPIKSNFREGLSISEFFISTHGGRKGVTDTALKTAESGYLTRRLVDVSQDIVVREDDCHTDHGFVVRELSKMVEGKKEIVVSLADRLIGRYAAHDIINPETKEVIVKGTIGREFADFEDELMTKEDAQRIVNAGITEVEIRSVLGCNTRNGVCKTCYGLLLATNSKSKVGDAVGIMAGQSIGEPGTQLTMRTFHSGGVAGDDIVQGLPRVQELVEARAPKRPALITEIAGKVITVDEDNSGRFTFAIEGELETKSYTSDVNSKPKVSVGDVVEAGDPLTYGSINIKDLLSVGGKAKVQNYILNEIIKVYATVGEIVSDKHIEIIIRQMFSKVWVENGYDTQLPPGVTDVNTFEDRNREVLLEGGQPAVAYPIIRGIKDIAKSSPSFLSAASFQETTAALTAAAINGRRDDLHGLKENVIVGKLIPAGTGTRSEEEEELIIDDFSVDGSIDAINQYYKY